MRHRTGNMFYPSLRQLFSSQESESDTCRLNYMLHRSTHHHCLSDRESQRSSVNRSKVTSAVDLTLLLIKTKLLPIACTHVTTGPAYCLSIVAENVNYVKLAMDFNLCGLKYTQTRKLVYVSMMS